MTDVAVVTNGVDYKCSRFVGNSSVNKIEGITINNFTIDGNPVLSLSDINGTENAFVDDIVFQK